MTADYFDQWYADMSVSSSGHDDLVREHLGLPPELASTSLLTLDGLKEVHDRLALSNRDVLLDLACGRGGYGLWLARQTGARLVGVDFSRVALELARARAGAFGIAAPQAEFDLGTLENTGLPDASTDAVLCVDAIQFADNIARAAAEIRRVLRPGGKVAITCWEAVDQFDERLPERIRAVDLSRQLGAAGLVDVVVEERRDWRTAEENMWKAAVAVDPADDSSLQSLKDEGERVLATFDLMRRVLATGRRAA